MANPSELDPGLLRAMNAPGGAALMQNINRADQKVQSRCVALSTSLQTTRKAAAQTRALYVNNPELQPFLNKSALSTAMVRTTVTKKSGRTRDSSEESSPLSKTLEEKTNTALSTASRIAATPNPLSGLSYEQRAKMKARMEEAQEKSPEQKRSLNSSR